MTKSNKKIPIKLLTLWQKDKEFANGSFCNEMMSHGIWESYGVEEIDKCRIYTFICVWPMHKEQKTGDKIRIYEIIVLRTCHQIQLLHLPKSEVAMEMLKEAKLLREFELKG